ncbi:hypothetical protein ABIA33_004892 [Streptacidiphilus sp. MAP12-16]
MTAQDHNRWSGIVTHADRAGTLPDNRGGLMATRPAALTQLDNAIPPRFSAQMAEPRTASVVTRVG